MPRAPCDVFDNFLSKILPGYGVCDLRDKRARINEYVRYMLNRTSQMFEWRNLPDSIPVRVLELYLQCNGNVCIYRHNDVPYPFVGGLGGEPNVYYMPTIYTIANPALNLSVNAVIGENCIVIPSDTLYVGLLPMITKYATLLVETELTLMVNLINSRVPAIVGSDNSGGADSAKLMFDDVERGKIGVVGTNALIDSLKSLPYSSGASHSLADVMEIEQYLRATLYNELGLQSNYNMKRAQLNDDEVAINGTTLLPLIDDMLNQRKIGADAVNAMFGTNISVDLKSSWKLTRNDIESDVNVANESGDENENIDVE